MPETGTLEFAQDTAKHLLKTWVFKEITENVLLAVSKTIAATGLAVGEDFAACSAGLVFTLFYRVSQYPVCFGYLFKFFFSSRIIRIAVGVILHGQFPVFFSKFLFTGCPGDPKNFIIIFHGMVVF